MDKDPNSYTNIDHQGLYSSTIPWDNAFDFAEEIDLSKIYSFGADADPSKIFDFDEEEDLSKIFDMPQEQHMNTTIIPGTLAENSSPNHLQNSENVSKLSNVIPKEPQPMTTTNIPSYSSALVEDDDFSSSYIYSMGVDNVSTLQVEGGTRKNSLSDGMNLENLKTFIPMPIVTEKKGDTMSIPRKRDQENPKTNDMILEQPLPKIPILEKLERKSSLKSKFTVNQPLKISTNSRKKRETPKAKDPLMPKISRLKRDFMKPTYHSNFGILEQKKLTILNQGSDSMKPKFFVNLHPYGISTSTRTEEQETPKTNGMILQRPMQHILTLEKIKNHLMRSKQEDVSGHGNGILSCLDNEFPHKTSTNEGPIRRSPNRINSRYQPLDGEIDPNNQGKSYSTQAAEIGKQNHINKEGFLGRNSNLVNHSNHNFQHSLVYTHEMTNKFEGVAISGQNFNEYNQGYDYSNQAITLRSSNIRQENKDEATGQLQSSWEKSWNSQDTNFNITTN